MKIGIIGGTVLFDTNLLNKSIKKKIKTEYGIVEILNQKDIFFIQRHGNKNHPPHMVNYKANIMAFKKLGVTKIIAINSVGSLNKKLSPGKIMIPDDYINTFDVMTFFDEELKHITPTMHNSLRETIIKIAKKSKIKLISKGIYFNSKGPRFETKSEINMFKKFAEIIGMTMANEATLAQELDLEYAAICSIDNYAHGLINKKLNYETMLEISKNNSNKIINLINKVLEELKCQL